MTFYPLRGTVAWDGFSVPSCLDRMYLEVFGILPVFIQGRAQFCSFKLKKIAVSWISTAAVSAPASTTAVPSAVSTATTAARGCGQSGPLLPRTDCCGLRYAQQQYSSPYPQQHQLPVVVAIRPLITQNILLWSQVCTTAVPFTISTATSTGGGGQWDRCGLKASQVHTTAVSYSTSSNQQLTVIVL